MTGNFIQYLLYALLAFTITLVLAGGYLTFHARRDSSLELGPVLGATLTGLALIAATAPYIGLVGTVWHIIQALSGIGNGNLNVAAIAKPIGEALYATLWGLSCAIPALIAHRVMLAALPSEDDEVVVPASVNTSAGA